MPSRESVMPHILFRLRHLLHYIDVGNASVGQVLICKKCKVVNLSPQQKSGSDENFKTRDEWWKYHEDKGHRISNMGGGTMEFICSCGSEY